MRIIYKGPDHCFKAVVSDQVDSAEILLLLRPGTVIVGSCALRFVAAREHCCPCEWGSRRRALEGGAEQTTAAVAKIGQHQRNVAAQGEIPAQGKAHYNILLLKDLRRGEKELILLFVTVQYLI